MIWCGLRYGASPANYALFDFRNANHRERKTFLTHRDNEKLMHLFNEQSRYRELEDKIVFASLMGGQYGRRYLDSSSMSYEAFCDLAKEEKLIYKPVAGGQGRGIQVFSVDETNLQSLYNMLKRAPRGIVETWLQQHPELNRLYPDSVNPLRIQTMMDESGVHIMTGTLTLGNGTKYANASAVRAIFALLDVETGKVITDGCDYDGNYYEVHPLTNEPIRGFQIPNWADVRRCVEQAAKRFPSLRYVGWDVAVTVNGPVIIEGNNDAGYTAYQYYPLTRVHQGIRGLYKHVLSNSHVVDRSAKEKS